MRPEERDLRQIIHYCERIENYLREHGGDEDDFLDNEEFQEGCAFCLIQIGEAVGRLSDEVRYFDKDMEWDKIKGLRNIIVHRYGTIWLTGVWQTMTEDIPVLKGSCISIQNKMNR